MSEVTTFAVTQIGVFNPGRLSDNEIERAFVTRIKLFEYLLKGITSETPESIPQHYLVIGQRGMGKSTLLHRIAVELRKEDYCEEFIPLTFPEEQYNLDRLSKFWLNCLDALADALDREGSISELVQLDRDIRQYAADAKAISAMEMYGFFARWIERIGLRPILLVDNLGPIFDSLSKEEQHQLRAILMTNGAPILVGASANTIADTVDYGAPFYDAFQIQYLKKLTFEETLEVLRNLALITNNLLFANELSANIARLRTLYQLTGGTPRTIVILYPLIQNGFSLEVQNDLEGLMDAMTPLYKARFEELPKQMQVILDAVALHWDPIALDDLRQITQLENSQLSPQLKRLTEVGWIERLNAYQKKGNAYQISERFFNIWYLMRRSSRRHKKELLCLTKFLVTLYGEDLNQMGERIMQNSSKHRDHISMQLAIADGVKDMGLSSRLRKKSYEELFELSKDDSSILKDFGISMEILSEQEEKLFEKAELSVSKEDWANSIQIYEEILAINPNNPTAWLAVGYIYCQYLDKFEKAEKAFKQAIKLNNHFATPWDDLGYLYQHHLLRFNEAEDAYRRAIDLDPSFASPWSNLGDLYQYRLGRYVEAEDAYKNAIKIDENSSISWYGLGSLYYYHLARYTEAENAYKKAILLDEVDADSWNDLGNLYQERLERYSDAEDAYFKSIELEKDNPNSWNGLGNLYQYRLNRYAEAENAYRRAIELDKNSPVPLYGLGTTLYQMRLDRREEAEELYKQAIELDPKYAPAWHGLGLLYQDRPGSYAEAEDAFEQAIHLDSSYAPVWNSLGNLYQYSLGRYLQAEEAYKRAIELENNSAYPWNGLGHLYQNNLSEYEQSEQAYLKAIEIDDQSSNAWNGLGNLYQDHLGKYEESERAYLKATEIDGEDVTAKLNLIFLYRDKIHRVKEARKIFELMGVPDEVEDSYWLNASLFELYDANLGIAKQHLFKALKITNGRFPVITQDDWWRYAAVSIRLGYGEAVLDTLKENGYDIELRPYYVAIQSLIVEDGTAFLNSIAVEIREVATDIADRIKRFM